MGVTTEYMCHSPTSSATKRLLVLSWLVVALSAAKVAWTKSELPPSNPLSAHVNPNVAPWWELTVLPEIGPSLARRIVDYRETLRVKNNGTTKNMVFNSAKDLDAVEGIGPKTIARLIPHLRFEMDEALSDTPSTTENHRQPKKKQD